MQVNKAKEKLKSGQTVFGCFVRYPSAGLVEVLGYQPWDFILFDAEHGVIEPHDCEAMVRAAELRGVTAQVRVTTNQPHVILRYMDSGVQGLHVPWVNSAAEAEAAVKSVKYYPRGIRGLAGVRAADYGQTISLGEYTTQANAQTMIILQVETEQAVEQIAEIAAVPDVDVIFIGPSDLSQSYGVPGQSNHPSVQAAIGKIADAVLKSPAALGIMVSSAEAAKQWEARGARYIAIGLEGILMPAARQYLQTVRGS